MVLYKNRDTRTGNWIIEADLRNMPLTSFTFYNRPTQKTKEMLEHEEQSWKMLVENAEKNNVPFYNGELICLKDVQATGSKIKLGISKSSYKEHHAACPVSGIQDGYSSQFFPFDFEIVDNAVIHKIPNFEKLFPAFAAATTLETADKKLVYLVRASQVDTYKNTFSLPSGGKFNGHPHRMVDELIQNPLSIQDHIKGMLQQEYDGLETSVIQNPKITGLALSLDDYDFTLCIHTKIDLTAKQLSDKLKKGKKYQGSETVSSDSDGIISLLRKPFPPTIYPVIVQTAIDCGVDPKDAVDGIERLI